MRRTLSSGVVPRDVRLRPGVTLDLAGITEKSRPGEYVIPEAKSDGCEELSGRRRGCRPRGRSKLGVAIHAAANLGAKEWLDCDAATVGGVEAHLDVAAGHGRRRRGRAWRG